MTKNFTVKEAAALIEGKLSRYFGVSVKEASKDQIYRAVALSIRDILLEQRNKFYKKYKGQNGKRVYYFCMEFLMGQSMKNNAYNLGISGAIDAYLKKHGHCLEELYDLEPDAGLGQRRARKAGGLFYGCAGQRRATLRWAIRSCTSMACLSRKS